jgi:hypothetical protein
VGKITIVGKGTGWEDAPLTGETWGITQLILRRNVSRVIDMNDYSLWGDKEAREAEESRRRAAELKVPYVDLSNYPLAEVIADFNTDYFSNTVDYTLALAIHEGFMEIDLYGVNMSNPGEYAYQKPGVEFWIGMAMGRGVNVRTFGDHSTILKTRDGKLYGYGTPQKGRQNGN